MSISIHALRMERDEFYSYLINTPFNISIHALRMERDYRQSSSSSYSWISIHALRMERDSKVV